MPFEEPKHLTADELIERWNGAVSKGTLNNWRSQGRGPDFVKPFGRVLYPLAAVEAWEKSHMNPDATGRPTDHESDT